MVRSKMVLTAITEHDGWPGKTLKFQARYDDTIPEDQRFQTATPSATAEYTIDNPAALAQMKLGQAYYVDFTAVEK